MAAAPIPATALETINMIMVFIEYRIIYTAIYLYRYIVLTCAAPQRTEPRRKTAIPNTRIHLRPKMSESLENIGSMDNEVINN